MFSDRILSVPANIKPFNCEVINHQTGLDWERWKTSFEYYIEAAQIGDPSAKKAFLLHYGGEQLQQVYRNLPKELMGPVDVYKGALMQLDSYFSTHKNEAVETDKFWNIKQESSEVFSQFYLRLNEQAKYCGFSSQLKNNIKTQLINKCSSIELKEKLLKKPRTLEEVLEKAAAYEAVKEQLKASKPMQTFTEVNKINNDTLCSRCGKKGHHGREQVCPAINKECFRCGRKGHFSNKCKTKAANRSSESGGKWENNRQQRYRPYDRRSQAQGKESNESNKQKNEKVSESVRKIESASHTQGDSAGNEKKHYIFAITGDVKEAQCFVGGIEITMVIDSGSKFNIIDQAT